MIRLSASLIKDVLSCTQKGYYRVNEPEQSVETPEMALGTVVHTAIEKHWDDQDLANEYATTQAHVREVDEKKALDLVNTYFKNFKQLLSPTDLTEKFFEFKYSDDIIIVGKLDRVNSELGFVIDWKTGQSTPSNIDNDPQFILYHYAFTRLYGKEPNLVAYISLSKGRIIRYNKVKFYYDNLFEEIIPKVADILRTKRFSKDGLYSFYNEKVKKPNTCNYCAFRGICWGATEES